jgi:spermidine synthase
VSASRSGMARLGLFYGGNTLGAVLGCLTAGFYLLPVLDAVAATWVAVGINFAVALAAWRISLIPDSAAEMVAADGGEAGIEVSANEPDWPVLAAAALSGAAALGAEVLWTRLLALVIGGTVFAFSVILAVFLAGIGVGGTAGAFVGRESRRPRNALAICQALLLGAVAWGAWVITECLPHWPVNPSLALSPWFTFQLDFAGAAFAVLPAALLWGASFPLALASVKPSTSDPGRMVGRVYAANTGGAIAGALATSLVLIPSFGTRHAGQALLVVVAGSSALLFGLPSLGPAGRARLRWENVGAIAAWAALLAWSTPATPWGLAAYGRYMATYGNKLHPGFVSPSSTPRRGGGGDVYCVYMGEGVNGTVAVTETGAGVRNFHSAGKVQASNDPHDMRLQRMLGHLAALAHPNPENVLVVACGAGVTAGSFVPHPEVRRITICDIEPLVPAKVAPYFSVENHNVIHDPRTRVVIDDGRHFVRTTHEMFDVITSDPIDPWVKGCAALNTVEYYEMCRARLKPGGVMALWIPLYESSEETVKSIVATFFRVFPDGILWSNDSEGQGYDAVLFGQMGGPKFDLDALSQKLGRTEYAAVRKSMLDAGFGTLGDLLITYAGQASDLGPWTRDAAINTDRNLRLQYLAGWSANVYASAAILDEIVQYRKFPENVFVGSKAEVDRLRRRFSGGTSAASH